MANDRKNKRAKRFFWLVCFILIITSCNEISEEYEPELNVFCILNNKNNCQKVIVDRTYKMDEKEQYDLEDVQVILSGNGLCDTLVQLYDSMGIFITEDSFPVYARAHYYLKVSVKGFDTLIGSTDIPDTFTISGLHNGDTTTYDDTLIIRKSKPNMLCSISFTYNDTASVELGLWNSMDSLEFVIPVSYILVCADGKYLIRIGLSDSNIYNYYSETYDSLPRCGVAGGVGLFGSMWTESLTVFLKTSR